MSGETYSTEGPTCPHCGRMFIPDESYYYDEHKFTETDCDECGKKFKVEVCNSTSWTCRAVATETPSTPSTSAQDAQEDGQS